MQLSWNKTEKKIIPFSHFEFGPLRASQIQNVLDEQTALVLYYLYHDTLVSMVVSRRGIVCSHIQDTGEKVETLVRETFLPEDALIFKSEGLSDLKAHLFQLWELLIAPIHAGLRSFDHLVVIPHGILHRCAFSALYDGEAYLLQRHTLSYAPSASIYALCRKQNRLRFETCLGFGYNPGDLPCVEMEVYRVTKYWGEKGVPFCGKNASKANFEKYLRGAGDTYDILHIASHCIFNPLNPLRSYIRLYGDGQEDAKIYTEEIASYNFSLSVVVLSACSSAQAAISPGDEIQGISTAFLTAGAASLVLTLWEVDDFFADDVMNKFYQFLIHGKDGHLMNKASSLRAALLKMIEKGIHPRHWAGYLLFGDERTEATAHQSLSRKVLPFVRRKKP